MKRFANPEASIIIITIVGCVIAMFIQSLILIF